MQRTRAREACARLAEGRGGSALKVVFASHGSLGDLVPFLEIGKVLAAAGHEVVIATHGAHAGAVTRAGLSFAPMRPDRPDEAAFHARVMAPFAGPAFVYRDWLGPAIAQSDADLMAAAEGADILVSVTLALAAPLVAARTGIPWLSAAFQPAMLYSAVDPPRLSMLPLMRGRAGYNAFVLEQAKKGVERWAAPLRQYRRAQGLGDYPDHPAFRGQHSPRGVLALYSPLFGAVPPDAPPRTVQTGQVLQSGGGELSPQLQTFLDGGSPPLVFTLGSAAAYAARRFFADAAAIARQLGMRAVLLVGNGANAAALPAGPGILVETAAPYHKVFPRAALAIHQGGIGTIALAIAAGTPMMLVPFAHDQPDNSARAARAGLATVVPRWRFGRGSALAIAAAAADAAMRQRVVAAAPRICAERGAETAAARILLAAQEGRIFLA